MLRERELVQIFRKYNGKTLTLVIGGISRRDFSNHLLTGVKLKPAYRIPLEWKILGYLQKITKKDYQARYIKIARERYDLIEQDIDDALKKDYLHLKNDNTIILGLEGDKLIHNWGFIINTTLKEYGELKAIILAILLTLLASSGFWLFITGFFNNKTP